MKIPSTEYLRLVPLIHDGVSRSNFWSIIIQNWTVISNVDFEAYLRLDVDQLRQGLGPLFDFQSLSDCARRIEAFLFLRQQILAIGFDTVILNNPQGSRTIAVDRFVLSAKWQEVYDTLKLAAYFGTKLRVREELLKAAVLDLINPANALSVGESLMCSHLLKDLDIRKRLSSEIVTAAVSRIESAFIYKCEWLKNIMKVYSDKPHWKIATPDESQI